MQLQQHPTVRSLRERSSSAPDPLTAGELKELALAAGADDAGVVSLDCEDLQGEREHLLRVFPRGRALLSFVVRLNREPVRSTARSLSNLEFHERNKQLDRIASDIVRRLEERGVAAINPSVGFPMEMSEFPGRIWILSHKLVAQAAGLGRMGIHRNLIHPRFGNFILLGTVAVGAEVEGQARRELSFDPCLSCKLCVAVCPVGAIGDDGAFDFSACYTHNYREFMGGFDDWIEGIAESASRADYRERTALTESVSMWQSLSYGPNYKSAYCMAVCPAGEDVIAPFLDDRSAFLGDVVRPLQSKEEPVYVVGGSDAQTHVEKRYPHKTAKRVRNGLRPQTIEQFLSGLHVLFQRGRAGDVDLSWHFTFTGAEPAQATIGVRDGELKVRRGLHGRASLSVQADSATWLAFLAGERNIVWQLIRRRVRVRGPIRHLRRFASLFPL